MGDLAAAIDKDLGGFDSFKTNFTTAAMGVFGAMLGFTQIHWTPSHRPLAMLLATIGSLGLLCALGSNRITLLRSCRRAPL